MWCQSLNKCVAARGGWLGPGGNLAGILTPSIYEPCIDWQYAQCAMEGRLLLTICVFALILLVVSGICFACCWFIRRRRSQKASGGGKGRRRVRFQNADDVPLINETGGDDERGSARLMFLQ